MRYNDVMEQIQKILESNKTPDEVEKEATRIISEQLFNYRIEELKNEFLFPEYFFVI